MTKQESIAWAAGFFEGEGSISCSSSNWQIALKNTDMQMLQRFQSVVGRGRIYPERRLVGKPIYVWKCGKSDDIYHAAALLWNYLSDRRQDQLLDVIVKRQEYLSSRTRLDRAHRSSQTGLCFNGHAMTKTNTYIRKDGSRSCLTCRRENAIRANNKKRELHITGVRR